MNRNTSVFIYSDYIETVINVSFTIFHFLMNSTFSLDYWKICKADHWSIVALVVEEFIGLTVGKYVRLTVGEFV